MVKGNPAIITGYTNTQIVDDATVDPLSNATESDPVLFPLTKASDIRGHLIAGEFPKHIPFQPNRMFIVHSVPTGKVRGEHAHKECHQFLIATQGSVNVILDDGSSRVEHTLSTPDVGLYIKPGVWGIQYKYSPGAVLLVLASHEYEPSDYIRDYDEFLAWKKENA
ncbi:FdtA/QdtA family cupin domain-containing protein [Verrucomicrobiota bacterium]